MTGALTVCARCGCDWFKALPDARGVGPLFNLNEQFRPTSHAAAWACAKCGVLALSPLTVDAEFNAITGSEEP